MNVARFRAEDYTGGALAAMAAWVTINANRVDVVTFVGDATQASLFYEDTGETDADGSEGAS